MTFHASSHFSTETDSTRAASMTARALKEAFASHPLRVVVLYATVTHDQSAMLRAFRAELGPDVPIVGCSVQGLMGTGAVHEGGYAIGAMGLGGESLRVAVSVERTIQKDTRTKGKRLGSQVISRLKEEPKVAGEQEEQKVCGGEREAGASLHFASYVRKGTVDTPGGPIWKCSTRRPTLTTCAARCGNGARTIAFVRMTVSLDPKTSALLVMDFQTAIVEGPAVHGDAADRRALLTRTAALIDAVRKAGMKVIYVVVGFRPGYPEASPRNKSFSTIRDTGRFIEGSAGTELHPAVAPVGYDRRVKRRVTGSRIGDRV